MPSPPYGGMPEFDSRILPRLARIPFFRLAPASEIDGPYHAYSSGQFDRLISVWKSDCAPTRADVTGPAGAVYRRARLLPRPVARMSFLATLRAVLAAGRDFFDRQLKPETARAIRAQFSYLERRHEHIPPGWTPPLRFPPEFALWVDESTLDIAKARFQLAAALNEVQQHASSLHLADLMDLPEVRRHAERERQMALAYLAHWAPAATRDLFAQSIHILDALNAAVFEMACKERALSFPARTLWSALSSRGEWAAFVRGMDRPQAL
jgi:hypothetical protein